MKTRTQRLLAIRNIINQESISTQEELMSMLKTEGFELTQATLSRDLKFVRAGKIPDHKIGYIYVLQGTENTEQVRTAIEKFPLNGFISIEFANHLGVMKVLPGYAGSIASTIDNIDPWEILGTIAGDDTILLIPRDGISSDDVLNVLDKIIPGVYIS